MSRRVPHSQRENNARKFEFQRAIKSFEERVGLEQPDRQVCSPLLVT